TPYGVQSLRQPRDGGHGVVREEFPKRLSALGCVHPAQVFGFDGCVEIALGAVAGKGPVMQGTEWHMPRDGGQCWALGDPVLAQRDPIEPRAEDALCRGVEQGQSLHPFGVADGVAEPDEAAVVVRAEVESLPPQPLHETLNPLDFVVVGRRCGRWVGPAEAWP